MKKNLAFFLLFLLPFLSYAKEEKPFLLDTVEIYAGREDLEELKYSKPVRVITKEELENFPGKSLGEVLQREAALLPRSGAYRSNSFDMRGMGDSFTSNILVLLDDIPMNSKDLSGFDFSSIFIEDIERIEIHKGAYTAQWGDGAVAGLIRIIRRKEEKAAFLLSSTMGSEAYIRHRLRFSDKLGGLFLNFRGGLEEGAGFRENSDFTSKDIGLDLFSSDHEIWEIRLMGDVYADDYGLPGPVLRGSDKKMASTPFDRADLLEKKISAQLKGNFGSRGNLKLQRSIRYKDLLMDMTGRQVESSDGFTPTDIKSKEKTARLDYGLPLFEEKLSLHLGLDHEESYYTRIDNDLNLNTRNRGSIKSLGAFFAGVYNLKEAFYLNLKGRYHHLDADYRLDSLEGTVWMDLESRKKSWDENAWELGLSWLFSERSRLYASLASSFRFPNVDELARSDEGLKPQKGLHMECGFSLLFPSLMNFELSLFSMQADDEIYYDAYTQENSNYKDKTIRRGLELLFDFFISESISLKLNSSYMQAYFKENNKKIPLVPELSAALNLNWEVYKDISVFLSGNYYSERYDGNDYDNKEKKLSPSQLWNLGFKIGDSPFSLFFEINNIFDEYLVMSSYSGADYPMPGRHFKIGGNLVF